MNGGIIPVSAEVCVVERDGSIEMALGLFPLGRSSRGGSPKAEWQIRTPTGVMVMIRRIEHRRVILPPVCPNRVIDQEKPWRIVSIKRPTPNVHSITDISRVPNLNRPSYPNGLLDSTENGLRRRESHRLSGSNAPILLLALPEQRLRPFRRSIILWPPLGLSTLRSVTSVSHAAPTAVAHRSAGCGPGSLRTTLVEPPSQPSGMLRTWSGGQPSPRS